MTLSLKKYFTIIILLLFTAFFGNGQRNTISRPYVVMLSLDGFRWDYPEIHGAPNLLKMAEEGVRTTLAPSYPSKTFPNHYTLVTGLHPGHHGIIHNYFYDPAMQKTYTTKDRDAVENGDFYGGEPLWITAEKQGVRAASYFWVGSEADVKKMHPTYWKKYDGNISFEQRIDSVIAWLQKPPAERPHLVTLYYHEPDQSGHDYGPESQKVKEAIHFTDKMVGVLAKKLNALPFADSINFIVLSDHGMGKISSDKVVVLSEHIKKEWVTRVHGSNPIYSIEAAPSYADSVYRSLKKVKQLKVYDTYKMPLKLHFGENPRTLDFCVEAKAGWSLLGLPDEHYKFGGTHGYNPYNNKDMHAIFFAKGPAFKKGFSKRKLKNVDIYGLVIKILQLEPAETDGRERRSRRLLRKKQP